MQFHSLNLPAAFGSWARERVSMLLSLARGCSAPGIRRCTPDPRRRFAYSELPLRGEDAVVVISHTTETAFAQRARQRVLESPARLVTITGQGKAWPEAVQTVSTERSETYTVSYLAALVVLARLSVACGNRALAPGSSQSCPIGSRPPPQHRPRGLSLRQSVCSFSLAWVPER